MEKKTYNGWANYETWAVALWIDNEQGSQQAAHELARSHWDDAKPTPVLTRSEEARYNLAAQLKDDHEENRPEVAGVYSDLLSAALSEVDWQEVANSHLAALEIDGYEPMKD